MAKQTIVQTNFTAGEISPRMFGRADFSKYHNGCEAMENFIPMPQGGVIRRSGTKYVANTSENNKFHRLIPFEFSDTQAYVLSFGDERLRFFKDRAEISPTCTIENGTFDDGDGWEDLSTAGASMTIGSGVMTLTVGSGEPAGEYEVEAEMGDYTLTVTVGANNVELTISTESGGFADIKYQYPVLANGTRTVTFSVTREQEGTIFIKFHRSWAGDTTVDNVSVAATTALTLTTPYDSAHLRELKYTQSADILYLTHELYPPHELRRYSNTSWELVEFQAKNGPYLTANTVQGHTMRISGEKDGKANLFAFNRGISAWSYDTVVDELTLTLAAFESGDKSTHEFVVGDTITIRNTEFATAGTKVNGEHVITAVPINEDGSITKITFSYGTDPGAVSTVVNNEGVTILTTGRVKRPTFVASDVGRLVRIKAHNEWGYVKITEYKTETRVKVEIVDPVDGITDTAEWALGAWSETTGYPRTAVFHQQRLWFAGTTKQPQTLWSSRSGDFNNFAPSDPDDAVVADHSVVRTVDSNTVDTIFHMLSDNKGVMLLTNSEEILMRARGEFDPITPDTASFVPQTMHGAKESARPARAGNKILFVQRFAKKVRQLGFQFEQDQFVAPDLSILAEHMTSAVATDSAYQQEPSSTFWMVMSSGQLIGMTYEPDHDVIAWHRHILGGQTFSDHTGASIPEGQTVVQSICVVPDDPYDLIWMTVKRTVDSAVVRTVEFMEDRFEVVKDLEDAFFVDGGVTYDNPSVAVSTITGLTHLEGETVQVFADGVKHDDAVVSSGQISVTLSGVSASVNVAQVGLGYTSKIITVPMRIRAGVVDQGISRRGVQVFTQFHRTVGGTIGSKDSDKNTINHKTAGALYTGYVADHITESEYRQGVQVEYQQTDPYPMTILDATVIHDYGGVQTGSIPT